MPFRSEKQRRFLWWKYPEIARRWTKRYGSRIISRAVERERRKGRRKK